jgi:hypothetical protein
MFKLYRFSLFFLFIFSIVCLPIMPLICYAQTATVVDEIRVPGKKLDGVAWDGKNIWVVTYQSSPIKWEIGRVDEDGTVVDSFVVPVDSLDDVHNFGMTNITSDGRTIWANHWNAGLIYNFSLSGKVLKNFGVPSVNQLIPVGIAWDGRYLRVLHWSDKNLYKVDKRGREKGSVSLGHIRPPVDMGLAWDGKYFWVGSRGANRITKISAEGEVLGYVKGPRSTGGIRDLDWDGKNLLVVYQQDDTIFKVFISD